MQKLTNNSYLFIYNHQENTLNNLKIACNLSVIYVQM